MISFKDFLTERVNSTKNYVHTEGGISSEDVSRHCGDSIKSFSAGKGLYRGHPISENGFFRYDGSKSSRRSTTMKGSPVMDLLSIFPGWQDYPLRSNGIICSTNKHVASTYNSALTAVLPYDGIALAICPLRHRLSQKSNSGFSADASDFKDSFKWGGVTTIGQTLGTVMKDKFGSYSKDQLESRLKRVGWKDLDAMGTKSAKQCLNAMDETGKRNLYDSLEQIMSPSYNGFKLVTKLSDVPHDREVWFSKQAIGVKCVKGISALPLEVQELCDKHGVSEEMFKL